MTAAENYSTPEYSDVEYVFEPHTRALPDIYEYAESMWERRRFMRELARADIRTARSRTFFGNLWSVLDPLFQASIYFFLYTVMRRGANGRESFLPILIGGIYLFSLTMSAMGEAGSSIKRAKGLMLNSTFPRALLPITNIYKNLKQFVVSACVFAVLFPLVGGHVTPALLFLPFLFAIQVVMNVGVALIVATFVTLVPDGQNFMTWVSRILFFATPVVYPVTLLPPEARSAIGWLPFFPVFANYQAVFSGELPNPWLVLQSVVWAVALLVVGAQLFLRHERQFAMNL